MNFTEKDELEIGRNSSKWNFIRISFRHSRIHSMIIKHWTH